MKTSNTLFNNDYTHLSIAAKALTPFYYHGLYAHDGSMTSPEVITDTALVFALRAALFGSCPALRDKPDYRTDLLEIPWRASLLLGEGNEIMPPIHHIIDVSREGGFKEDIRKNMDSGNFKNRFFVHEVAADATYQGLLYGIDPFKFLNTDHFVIRVGVGRLGMLELSPLPVPVKEVRLNTATAKLFQRQLPEAYRILDTIRVSQALSATAAGEELRKWY